MIESNVFDTTVTARAEALGEEHGTNAGTWIVEDAEQARQLAQWDDEGAPEWGELAPSPLSGEWADSMTPALLMEELGIDDERLDSACDAYEDAFFAAFYRQVQLDIAHFV